MLKPLPFLVAGKSPLPSPVESSALKELLEHIKEFKEDGNSFFKKGDVDSALEKYGFTGIFLNSLALEMKEDRETIVDIKCVVLLNMAACFLRKKEFILAGKFCTIVLYLHPTSVKALFRRASAAMELCRIELVVTDFELAYVIDLSNQEVCKKLSEAKVRILKEMEDLSENPKLASVEEEKLKEETHEMIEDVITKEVEKPKKAKGREEVEKPKEVEMTDADCSRKCGRGRALMGSKHRFDNRLHQWSFLIVSKQDYSKLTQGKTFQYYNARSGVILSMRVVGCQKIITKQGENKVIHSSLPDSILISEFEEEVDDNFNDQLLN
ncbi:Peptidyl-prolyl cis-trans isomerase FKBP62 [Bienertia sinuspersici]